HARVALHLLLDLESRDRPPFGHQERDQRELADELLGVLGHGESSIRVNRWRTIRLPRQRRDGFPLFASLAPRRTAAGYAASPSPRVAKYAGPARARSNCDQRSPPARPLSSRSKLPSRPPRLSIMCTSVASRVHGTTGLPCSSCPWWARMMCSRPSARAGGKPGMSSIARRTV